MLDDTGGMDYSAHDHSTGSDDLTVEYDGEVYGGDANLDLNHDGVNETFATETADGGAAAIADTDGDGTGDTFVEVDSHGNLTDAATYDEATGEWTAADTSHSSTSDSHTGVGSDSSASATATTDSSSSSATATSAGYNW